MSSFREEMPNCAANVDEFKNAFGSDVKVLMAKEGDRYVAANQFKKESEYSVVLDCDQALRLGELAQQEKERMKMIEARKSARS